jgi:hypothetical protein
LERKTRKRSRSGSIHMSVPVHPVWPNEESLVRDPNAETVPESRSGVSQPSTRVPLEGERLRKSEMVLSETQTRSGRAPRRSQA